MKTSLILSPRAFIDGVFEQAKLLGLSDKELAQKARITPVGLSKIKTRKDLRLSTALKLLQPLHLNIVLTPKNETREDAIALLKTGKLSPRK